MRPAADRALWFMRDTSVCLGIPTVLNSPPRAHSDILFRAASKEAQRGAAIEMLNRVDGEAADREADRLRTASG